MELQQEMLSAHCCRTNVKRGRLKPVTSLLARGQQLYSKIVHYCFLMVIDIIADNGKNVSKVLSQSPRINQ